MFLAADQPENTMRDFRLNAPAVAMLLVLAMLSGCEGSQVATEPAPNEPAVPAEPADPTVASGLRAETQIIASGNEPFWSVEVDGAMLTYKTPELMPGATFEAEREETADGVRLRGVHDGREFMLEVRDEQCQDSMSGATLDFTATVTIDGEPMAGCAWRAADRVEPAP